jgi:glycosyltransferase involved in cell wall biosynthesis
MIRMLLDASRLVAVHGRLTRERLIAAHPDAADRVVAIRLGHGVAVDPAASAAARTRVRARYGIPDDAVLFGCFGGLTPDKRIPQILAAMRAILPHAPDARLLLAGSPAAHYGLLEDIAAQGLQSCTTVTGYLEAERDLTDHLAACDVSLNLRWPTAGETSGPWLRALAAGVATVTTDLAHLGEVPSLDPRTWTVRDVVHDPRSAGDPAVCVAVDILDEDHSLRLAMRRLAVDVELRTALALAGRQYWQREHTVEAMVDDYERIMPIAAAQPDPKPALPAHARDAGERKLQTLLAPFHLDVPW